MKNYRLCQIYHGSPKNQKPDIKGSWYVYYYFNVNWHDPGKKPLYIRQPKIKNNINRIKTISGRMELAKEICQDMNNLLKAGYNPYQTDQYNQSVLHALQSGTLIPENAPVFMPSANTKAAGAVMTLEEALIWSVKSKRENNPKWKDKMPSGYPGVIEYFTDTCRSKGYLKLSVHDFSVIQAREIIQIMVNNRSLGDHAYLKFKNVAYSLFKELLDWGKINTNPCDYNPNKQKPVPKAKPAFEEHEKMLIKKAIMEYSPRFYAFHMILFHTHIRPVEICRLRIEYVNMGRREIFLPKHVTKSARDRYAIIPNALVPYLESLEMHKYDPHLFLFGANFMPEERNQDVKKDRAIKICNNYGKLWKAIVKDKLKIDKNMYWLKDEGVNSKSDAGLNTQAIRLQTGHASTAHTDAYLSRDIRRKDIKDQLQNLDIDF